MDERALRRVNFISGDITDVEKFERAVVENQITHLIHLAALQVPFVRADPIQGARVNVVGTAVVLETVKRQANQIQGFAYASSVGVYGPSELYPPGPLAHDAPPNPTTLYGVYKEANEGMARIYWQDYQIASIGLRPSVLYGPGRDQGMTSTPTKGMLAAAVGKNYHISYGGRVVFQYADDMAALFIRAARANGAGAPVFNPSGTTAEMEQVIAAIESAAPDMAGKITFEPTQLGIPPQIDDSALTALLGPMHWTPLDQGVRETIELFRGAAKQGKVNVEKILG
jgi:nucleoside-diphosphate-sugar epimerase